MLPFATGRALAWLSGVTSILRMRLDPMGNILPRLHFRQTCPACDFVQEGDSCSFVSSFKAMNVRGVR